MPSTVKLPILGNVNKGTAVGIGIGGVTVAGYLVYRQIKKGKQAAAAAAAAQDAASSSGYGYGYGMPPGQFYGYGEPGAYGYGASGGFPAGYYGYGTPFPGQQPPGPTANATNAQWDQAAIAQLTSDGYDSQTVAGALGAYLHGDTVTAAQQSIIQAAIGIEGYPPDAGPNGYPPSIKVQGTGGGGTGGGQGGGQGGGHPNPGGPDMWPVPDVVGERADDALKEVRAAGFKAKTSPARNPAKTYIVTAQQPSGSAAKGTQVTLRVAQHNYADTRLHGHGSVPIG